MSPSDSKQSLRPCQNVGGHPADGANPFSFATFSWMNDIMSSHVVPQLSSREGVERNVETLRLALEGGKPVGTALWSLVRKRVYFTTFVYLSSIVLGFIGPTLLMRRVLTFTASSEAGKWEGLTWVGLLILCEFGRVLLFTLTWALSYRTALRLRAATMGLVYRKLLRVHSPLGEAEASKMINVIGTDCGRIYDAVVLGQVAIAGPVVLILSAIYIVWELGWFSLLGMIVFPLAYPLQYLLARGSGSFRRRGMEAQDSRISILTQSLHNIKFLKMFGWEPHFHRLVAKFRAREVTCLRGSGLLSSASTVLGPTLPHVGVIITFLIYLNSGTLTPAQCFTILFVFSLVGYSVRAVNQLADIRYNTKISTQRLQSLLRLPEVGDCHNHWLSSDRLDPDAAVQLENATLTIARRVEEADADESKLLDKGHHDVGSFHLNSLTIVIKRGSIVGVCGCVGSGKSTLLEGIAGCIMPTEGYLHVVGRVAYVPQTPWLFKGTIRENIVFGEPFDSIRYYNTVDACCLTPDFGSLPLGDLTEIDGNGSNLSGGQRSRVALARAVYSFNRDIFVWDDPFSSLDAKVAITIWDRVVKGLLRQYTLVVSTHLPQFLEQCDQVVLLQGGTIALSGTHQELILRQTTSPHKNYAQLLHSQSSHISLEEKVESFSDIDACSTLRKKRDSPHQGPASNEGSIPWSVVNLWVGGAGGILVMLALLFVFAISIGSTAFSSWWLKYWFRTPSFPPIMLNNATDGSTPPSQIIQQPEEIISADQDDNRFVMYRNVYAAMIGVIFITALFRAVFFAITCVKASKSIHEKMSLHLFRSRLKVVDRLGFGHLVNLFSRDIGEVDWSLPTTLEQFLQNVFIILAIFCLVSIVFPIFLAPLAILSLIFVWVRSIYKSAIRVLKRVETEAKTPIFSKMGETIQGLATIRSYGKQTLLTRSFEESVDDFQAVAYTSSGAIRWLAIRLDCLAVAVTGLTAILVLLFHGSVSAAAAGLALAYAAQLSGVFQFTVRLASETEAKFVSVERIHKFLMIPTEEGRDIYPNNSNNANYSSSDDDPLLSTWPFSGRIKYDAVTLTYSSDARPALNQVSFEVMPGQKVGVVGRTGCGKTSLGNALFRLNELWSGEIFLDGVNIATVPVKRLRESLCVVPQEPAVFPVSVRHNLDPGEEHGDAKLWEVLRKVGLVDVVESLDTEMGFSLGQQQLLCVARALLRNAKVVFLDEAISSVDAETGAVIDRLLATEFEDATVFLVAHRMSALSRCDVILLLEDGQVRDFGPTETVTKKSEFIANFDHFERIPL
ncbi:multidrug resistance-associated protein 5 [Folsomia candida]|nr:multidrug resistance-associated protein 5 [Folsomia candida]